MQHPSVANSAGLDGCRKLCRAHACAAQLATCCSGDMVEWGSEESWGRALHALPGHSANPVPSSTTAAALRLPLLAECHLHLHAAVLLQHLGIWPAHVVQLVALLGAWAKCHSLVCDVRATVWYCSLCRQFSGGVHQPATCWAESYLQRRACMLLCRSRLRGLHSRLHTCVHDCVALACASGGREPPRIRCPACAGAVGHVFDISSRFYSLVSMGSSLLGSWD
jgi:hypothetical protein